MKKGLQRNDIEQKLSNIQIPQAVQIQQVVENNAAIGKEQTHSPAVNLFFSFDIVNSTMYKSSTNKWAIVIKSLLGYINKCVVNHSDLATCSLWRIIGDELVFAMPVSCKEEISRITKSVFETTQEIDKILRNGNNFDTLFA